METIINILKPFFNKPHEKYHIREIAKIIKINHTTIRKYLNRLTNEKILKKKIDKPYPVFCADISSKKYLNFKLFFNLEKIRISKLVERLEDVYDYPVIVLFGSYAKASDDYKSDIDIFVLTDIKHNINLKLFEKMLERNISLHIFNERKFIKAKTKNPELINNVCNGITLSGQLEILK